MAALTEERPSVVAGDGLALVQAVRLGELGVGVEAGRHGAGVGGEGNAPPAGGRRGSAEVGPEEHVQARAVVRVRTPVTTVLVAGRQAVCCRVACVRLPATVTVPAPP